MAGGSPCSKSSPKQNQRVCSQERVKKISVTKGQMEYEWQHFLQKMKKRDPERFKSVRKTSLPDHHPLFRIKPGDKEEWEK
jgi:hypothetical protein